MSYKRVKHTNSLGRKVRCVGRRGSKIAKMESAASSGAPSSSSSSSASSTRAAFNFLPLIEQLLEQSISVSESPLVMRRTMQQLVAQVEECHTLLQQLPHVDQSQEEIDQECRQLQLLLERKRAIARKYSLLHAQAQDQAPSSSSSSSPDPSHPTKRAKNEN